MRAILLAMAYLMAIGATLLGCARREAVLVAPDPGQVATIIHVDENGFCRRLEERDGKLIIYSLGQCAKPAADMMMGAD